MSGVVCGELAVPSSSIDGMYGEYIMMTLVVLRPVMFAGDEDGSEPLVRCAATLSWTPVVVESSLAEGVLPDIATFPLNSSSSSAMSISAFSTMISSRTLCLFDLDLQ